MLENKLDSKRAKIKQQKIINEEQSTKIAASDLENTLLRGKLLLGDVDLSYLDNISTVQKYLSVLPQSQTENETSDEVFSMKPSL